MRRVAALYDIHGNLPALDAALADVAGAGVDAIVVGGDLVPGPMPRACLERLQALDLPVLWLHGNGEHDMLDAAAGRDVSRVPAAFQEVVRWSGDALGADLRVAVAAWPDTVTLHVDGLGDVLFCHATPDHDNDLFTRDTDEAVLRPVFAAVTAAVVICGHTHMAFDRQIGHVRVINAGSVGMPFGMPGAHWALLGPRVELRRVDYDLPAAADAVRATAYPQASAFADRYILAPPPEGEMLDAFGNAVLASRRRSP